MPRKLQTRDSSVSLESPKEESFVKNNIALDELIKVVSLVDHPIVLLENGRNAKYRFDGFGQVKLVIYQDVLQILEKYQTFMNRGIFMILDQRVIDRHGLHDIQSNILPKEKIERILDGSKEAIDIFKSSSDEQKNVIIGMITRRLVNDPKSVDLNVVDEISRLTKINIQQNAEESRELFTKKETAE